MSLEDKFARLQAAAGKLNDATDGFNETIEAVEDRLERIGVGLTYWLDGPKHIFAQEQDSRAQAIAGKALGYAKLDEGWCLAVKSVVFTDDGTRVLNTTQKPVALLKAGRLTRVEAARQLEPLIEALAAYAESLVNGVEAARRAVATAIKTDAS